MHPVLHDIVRGVASRGLLASLRLHGRAAGTLVRARLRLRIASADAVRAAAQRAADVPLPARDGARDTRDVIAAVKLWSRAMPRTSCLARALAAQELLATEGRSSRVVLGVTRSGTGGNGGTDRDGKTLRAHAWLEAGGEVVIGGGPHEHTVLGALEASR